MTTSPKDVAQDFLRLIIEGEIAQAYATYVSPDFRHHNAYYKSDAASLQKGMEENHALFPHKVFDIQRVIAEGDLVAVHSLVRLSDDKPPMSVVHIFRFSRDRIVELWDVAQPAPAEIVNDIGMF